jgi:hypothetical protein
VQRREAGELELWRSIGDFLCGPVRAAPHFAGTIEQRRHAGGIRVDGTSPNRQRPLGAIPAAPGVVLARLALPDCPYLLLPRAACIWIPQVQDQIWWQVFWFALPLGAGIALLAAIGFFVKSARARVIGPNRLYHLPVNQEFVFSEDDLGQA